MNIRIEKTKNPKKKPNENEEIEFGSVFTDHMFIMDYNSEKGWNNPRIIEYQPIVLDPSALVFHYGQSMF